MECYMVNEVFKKIDLKRIKSISKVEMLERAYQIGFEYERTRYGCSQCVVAAIENVFGFDFPDLVKSSYPLAGGVATTTEGTCGALSGGVLIIGYLFGRDREEFKKNVFNRRALFISKPLYDKFIQEYGTCICKGVQKKIFNRSFNLLDKEEMKLFEEAGGHKEKCPNVVGKCSTWVAEIIWNEIINI